MENNVYGSVGVDPTVPKVRKMWPYYVAVCLLILFSAGGWLYLSLKDWGSAADNMAQQFHIQLNSEQYEQIYSQSSPAMKAASNPEQFSKFLAAVHRKLGNAKGSSRLFLQVNRSYGKKLLVVNFSTKFEKGTATETFTWLLVSDEKRQLEGYNINSAELVAD